MKRSYKNLVPLFPSRDRLNPQMLRILLAYLVHSRFEGVKARAYKTLKTSRLRVDPKTRKPLVPFDKNSLPDVLNDKRKLSYIMLESFADEANVPTWLLLLFSRCLSDDIDSQKSVGSEISEADLQATKLNITRTKLFLERLPDLIENEGKPLEVKLIDDWIQIYNSVADEDQGQLV